MEIACCEKGHFYDAERNKSCPQCVAENQGTGVSGRGKAEPIGATTESVGVTEPVNANSSGAFNAMGSSAIGETMPVSDLGFGPSDFVPAADGNSNMMVQDYEPTMPVSPNGVAGFNPVVGWLVCVDGPNKGNDYRIHNGNNYIGRDASMDICIRNDNHISNLNAAIIGYDDVERQFFFGPAGGHNTVRVNKKMVINAVTLSPYDELTVGTTTLMFVPLCGERFDWNA